MQSSEEYSPEELNNRKGRKKRTIHAVSLITRSDRLNTTEWGKKQVANIGCVKATKRKKTNTRTKEVEID
jgi:hypothetical protein